MLNVLKKRLFGDGRGKTGAAESNAVPVPGGTALKEAAALVSQGNALLDQGKPGQAADRYRRAATLNPADASVLVNLGYAMGEQGMYAEATEPLMLAIALDPQSVDAYFVLGTALKELGNAQGAIENYRKVLALRQDFPLCRLEVCRLLVSEGKPDQAKEAIGAGIALTPNVADFHFYLGNVLLTARDFDAAIGSFETALSLQPDHADAMVNLGSAQHAKEDYNAALESFERAIRLQPTNPVAHWSIAATLLAIGKIEEGIEHFRTALEINPNYVEAHCDLATALQTRGKLDEAIEHYRIAVSVKPDFTDALSNLGIALQGKGRFAEAIDFLQRALAIDDKHAAAHNNLGNVFRDVSRLEESVACFRRALQLKPDYDVAHGNLGGVLQEQCRLDEAMESYKKAIELNPDFRNAQDNLLFTVNYHADLSPEQVFDEYRLYDERWGVPLRSEWRDHDNRRGAGDRLRVGYVSPDLRTHSIRHFLLPLLEHHDKRAVEVFAYAELIDEDAMTARYRRCADHWIPTVGMTDEALAERIRADGIDVLIDLAGHTAKNRLGVFARKPAPVSVSWLGYGYTTGLSAIDYMLTDDIGAPLGSEHLFSEKPWRLATPGYAFRPAESMGPVGLSPVLERGHITFGTLTRAVRINHRSIRVWSEIMHRVPGSRLVVNSKSYQDAGMRASLTQRFAEHGIATGRLELGCTSPPWDVLRSLDIGLDCFPHNSGTTLFETLYMGVPFVTLADRPSVGRLGSSILHGVGHPEWIAHTEDEYIEIAVRLASDPSALADLRGRLRAEMDASPLRDEVGFARKAEAAYRNMFEIWAAGSSTGR